MQISTKFVLTIEGVHGDTMLAAAATHRKSSDVCSNTLCGIMLAKAPVLAARGHFTNDMQAQPDCAVHGNPVVLAYTRLPAHVAEQIVRQYFESMSERVFAVLLGRAADAVVEAACDTCLPLEAMFHASVCNLRRLHCLAAGFRHCRTVGAVRLLGGMLPVMKAGDISRKPDAFKLLETMVYWQSSAEGAWWKHIDCLIGIYKRSCVYVQARTHKSVALVMNLFVPAYAEHMGDDRLARLVWHLLQPCINLTQLDHGAQPSRSATPLLQELATHNCSVLLAGMLAAFEPRVYKTLSALGHAVVACVLQGMTRWGRADNIHLVHRLPLAAVACTANACAYAAVVKLSALTGAKYAVSLLEARAARHADYLDHCARGCPASADTRSNPLVPLPLLAMADKRCICLFDKVRGRNASTVGSVQSTNATRIMVRFDEDVAMAPADVVHAGTFDVLTKLRQDSAALQPLVVGGASATQAAYMAAHISRGSAVLGPLKYVVTNARTVTQVRKLVAPLSDLRSWLWIVQHGHVALRAPQLKVTFSMDLGVRRFVDLLMRACMRLACRQQVADSSIWRLLHTGSDSDVVQALEACVLPLNSRLVVPPAVVSALRTDAQRLWQAAERLRADVGVAALVFAAFRRLPPSTLRWYGGTSRMPHYAINRPAWLYPRESRAAACLLAARNRGAPLPLELYHHIFTFL